MSRELKFRYWDIINETMIEDAHLMDSFNEKIARPGEYHVMQYTGLKDKKRTEEFPKGQPIYEADWARMPFFWRYKEGSDDIEEEGYYEGEVVIIASRGVCMRNPIRHKYNLTKDTPEEIVKLKQYQRLSGYASEVIGNIHQHPHLLTTQKPG